MRLLHQNATPEALNFFRKIVFSAWLLIIAFNPIWEISRLPLLAIEPTGIFLYWLPKAAVPVLIHPVFLISIYAVTLLSIIFVIINRSVFWGILACFLLTVYGGLIRSIGHMNHAEIAILYAAYFLVFFPMLDSLLNEEQKQKINLSGIPLVLTLLLLSLTYSHIAIHRFAFAWAPIYTPDSMTGWILQRSYERDFFAAEIARSIESYPLFNAMLGYGFALVTLFEILAPLVLVSRIFRRIFLVVIGSFHILCLLLMKIFFWENLVLFVLLFDISRWISPSRDKDYQPVIFYDGLCGLCNRFVVWVLERDRSKIFRFAPLQGEAGSKIFTPKELQDGEILKSVVLKEGDSLYYRSDAVFKILDTMGGVWRIISGLRYLPRFLRDGAYNFIAHHRYQWFGKFDVCRIPKPEEKARFLP